MNATFVGLLIVAACIAMANAQWFTSCYDRGVVYEKCLTAMTKCDADRTRCHDKQSCIDCVRAQELSCFVCATDVSVSEQFPRGTYNRVLAQCNGEPSHNKMCKFFCASMSFPFGNCLSSNKCYCSWTNELSEQFSDILSNEEAGKLQSMITDHHLENLDDKIWIPLYHSKENGEASERFSAKAFHEKCDGRANTLTIIKTVHEFSEDTFIFGGYTSVAWSKTGGPQPDAKAFIFSLMNLLYTPQFFKIKVGGQDAVRHEANLGPTFGGIEADLQVGDNGLFSSNLGKFYYSPDISGQAALSFLAGGTPLHISELIVYQHN